MTYIHATVPEFPLHRLLSPDGGWQGELPAFLQDPALWREAYTHLWRTRLFDRRAIALQRTGQLGTYAGCLGQEAVSAAAGFTLTGTDISGALLPGSGRAVATRAAHAFHPAFLGRRRMGQP